MSTMSQLGEFLATIQNKQDARTAELEARLAELEGKKECECAESITALEERLATLEGKEECGCAETITALEARLAELESKEECGCAETITALEERLATLESKEECGCGSYDELLASYEERISALEGNAGGGSTEGEGGSTEGEGGSTEGEGGDSGSTEGGEEGGNTEGEGEEGSTEGEGEGEGGSTEGEGEGGSTEGEGEGVYPVAIVFTRSDANTGSIYALPKEGTAVAYFKQYTTTLSYEASNEFSTVKVSNLLSGTTYPTYALMSDNSLISISTVEDIGLDPNSDEGILVRNINANKVNTFNLYLINGERYGIRFGNRTASIIDISTGAYDHHFESLQEKINELTA